MQGLILFAHGARDPRWAAPLRQVAARIRAQRPGLALGLAFLEHDQNDQPDLATAAAELARLGCTRIDVLPAFVGVGSHLRQELPRLVEALRKQHPGLQITAHALKDLKLSGNLAKDRQAIRDALPGVSHTGATGAFVTSSRS